MNRELKKALEHRTGVLKERAESSKTRQASQVHLRNMAAMTTKGKRRMGADALKYRFLNPASRIPTTITEATHRMAQSYMLI